MSEEKDSTKQTKVDGPSIMAKAAETIAGDNKLLATILKILLSPLGLIAALCGIGYLWWKNSTYKSKITELEKELQLSKFTIKELETDLKNFEKESYFNTHRKEDSEFGHVPFRRSNMNGRNIHLD